MLDFFEALGETSALKGWSGLGLAVQGYQKRAIPALAWLADLARRQGRRIPVRLVKGAYWDTEIKRGQELGLADYPVFTRKAATDTSYVACARAMLAAGDAIYPQFATHNAHTVAAIDVLAGGNRDFEYQRLHGMGEALHEIYREERPGAGTRIYAPVGSHEDLLAYLVRRLLENGANTSFVNRLADSDAPLDDIIADPVAQLSREMSLRNPRIALPADMLPGRKNSSGFVWADPAVSAPAIAAMEKAVARAHRQGRGRHPRPVRPAPHRRRHRRGERCRRRATRSPAPTRRRANGTSSAPMRAPASWSVPPISTRRTAPS